MKTKTIRAKKWKREPKERVFEKRPKYLEVTRVYWSKAIEVVQESEYKYEVKH